MVNKLLKLVVLLILIAIVIMVIVSCINNKNNDNIIENVYEFSGVVDEISATSIVVIPNEDEEIRNSSDRIEIAANGVNYFKGDKVTVRYNSDISETYPAKLEAISVIKQEYSKAVKLYITLIDGIMNEDKGLNENIEYLSIDTTSFKQYDENNSKQYMDITNDDKVKIINYCSRYNSDVRAYSLDELKEQDLFSNQTMSLNGMVIYVEKIYEFGLNNAKIQIVKYVGATGAYFATYTLKYVDNMWKIIDSEFAIS